MRLRQIFLLAAAIGATGITAPAVTPRWEHENYPCRIQFACTFATNGVALLPFYHKDLGFEPDAFQITGPPPGNDVLPWRLLGKSPDRTLVLVQLAQPVNRTVSIQAYAAPAGVPRVNQDPDLKATFPISVIIQPISSRFRGTPNTVERLLYMQQSITRPGRILPAAGFPPSLPRDEHATVLKLCTYVLCPGEGAYGFRATSTRIVAGTVNGAPLTNGQAIVNGPDCVPVQLLTAAPDGQTDVTLEWRPPGAPDYQPIPLSAFAGPALAVPRKVERIDRTLQPQFEADTDTPYGFRYMPGVFYPLTLTDRSENWLPYEMNETWVFENGASDTNGNATHTFTNEGPHAITLALGDELGFTTSLTHVVSWESAIPKRHLLSAVPFPMAAAWFRSDILEPALLTQGNWPASLELRLTTRLTRLAGSNEMNSTLIPPTHSPRITRLAACPAADFDTLEWSLSHLGVVLTNGIFAALHPPFPSRPVRLAVDRLEDDSGRQLVYVVPRRPAAFMTPSTPTNAPLMLIDDFITARAAPDPSGTPEGFSPLLADALGEPVRILPLSDWREASDTWKPILKMAEVPGLASTSTPSRILLALGGQDCALGVTPEQFERQAAALSDLLLQAGHRVTWITPPPFPERPDKARLYAVAIRRVAESRGLPVADLYSLFAGAESGGAALFDPVFSSCLSPQGRRLAAERIAEQMRRPPPSGEPPP